MRQLLEPIRERPRFVVWLSVLLGSVSAFPQNLVTNPGFETYSALPTTYAQVCLATGWSSANGSCSLVVGCGSPEFYHTSAAGGVKPPATYWANVMPHSGSGMVGFAPWYLSSPTFREYVRTTLSSPMVVGQTYEVGFWITNGVSTIHPYGINHFGVAFSTTPLIQSCGAQIVYTPQLEYPGILFSTGWQYVSMLFTPTQPFQYMCIGDFVPFASTTYQSFGGSGSSGSYYYMDDIVVQLSTTLPVELLDFDVRAVGSDAEVRWSTAAEHALDHFIVERSRDMLEWEQAGSVPAAGESNLVQDYALLDPARPAGTDYYRLRSVDEDGRDRTSRVVVATFGATSGLLAWPQPCNGEFTLQGVEGTTVLVMDDLGREVEANLEAPPGLSTVRVRLGDARAGLYLVRDLGSGRTTRILVDPLLIGH